MAIKGKGRSKRRGVATAPKPVYVKPTKPLFVRRWFLVTLGLVVGLGAIGGVITGLLIQHHNNQKADLRAKETTIVQRFGRLVDDTLAGVGQPFQTQFQAFPDLTSDVSKLKSGDLSDADAAKEGEKWSKAATDAAAAIRQIPTAQLIEGHADLVDLSDGQNLLVDGLNLFGQVADSLKLAAQSSDPSERKDLIAHTESLLGVATTIFNDGYQKLQNERDRFDLLSPVTPTAPQTSIPTIQPSAAVTVPVTSPSARSPRSPGTHKKKK